jgi:hypothetical protein
VERLNRQILYLQAGFSGPRSRRSSMQASAGRPYLRERGSDVRPTMASRFCKSNSGMPPRFMSSFQTNSNHAVYGALSDRSLKRRTGSSGEYRRLPAMLILAGLLLTVGAAAYAQSMPSNNVFRRGWLGAPASQGVPHAIAAGDRDGSRARERDNGEASRAMQPLPQVITDQ